MLSLKMMRAGTGNKKFILCGLKIHTENEEALPNAIHGVVFVYNLIF